MSVYVPQWFGGFCVGWLLGWAVLVALAYAASLRGSRQGGDFNDPK